MGATLEQAEKFVADCKNAGICYACGFSNGIHAQSCYSSEAKTLRGDAKPWELPPLLVEVK